ncbi:MAG TPA: hypothetical protein VK659_10215, partial [Asanoa sp.]|nr:hypothetical protein [Asanoa sp.]
MAGIPPWLKDKRVQLGIVAAAGLGVIVAVSRGKGALGGGDGDGTGSTITPTTLDSTGTDLYNAIQSVSQGFSDDLRALYDQLRNSGQL